MVAEYTPALGAKLITLGSTYDDGLGIRLGMSAGAERQAHGRAVHHRARSTLPGADTGLIVNSRGERFVAEDSYHARTSQFVMEQRGLRGVPHRRQRARGAARDAAGAAPRRLRDRRPRWRQGSACRPGRWRRHSPGTTSYAARGEDPDFHKSADWLAPQDQGPWAVFDLRLGHALYAGFTLGGLRTTVDGAGAAGRRFGHPGAVRGRSLRVQHRPGRQGLQLGHPARRGIVLRPAGWQARGSAPASERASAKSGTPAGLTENRAHSPTRTWDAAASQAGSPPSPPGVRTG